MCRFANVPMCQLAHWHIGTLANSFNHPVIPPPIFCVIPPVPKSIVQVEISDSLQEIIVSYYEGNLAQSQADELLAWVRQNDENLRYFRQMGDIWQATNRLNQPEVDKNAAIKVIQGKITERGIRRLPGREIRLRLSTLFRIAAAIVVLIALGTSGLLIFKKNQSYSQSASFVETSAPKGSRSLITLSDGTTVWLNADTKFRYPLDYGTSNRNVYLEGEAYFKVSENRNLPFRVNTSDITVTALGTAFNVKAYKEEGTIETTLEEGRVRIDAVNAAGGAGRLKPVVLKPNQNAVFQKQAGELVIRTPNEKPDKADESSAVEALKVKPIVVRDVSDTRPFTSWKDQRWIFKNEKLGSLVPKLERRYAVNIVFVDKALEDYAFNGTLLEESLEQVLAAIRLTAPIRYEINAKEVRLFEDKKLMEQYKNILNP